MAYRLVVLASGSGTLAQAILDARVDLECEILAVISDEIPSKNAIILEL